MEKERILPLDWVVLELCRLKGFIRDSDALFRLDAAFKRLYDLGSSAPEEVELNYRKGFMTDEPTKVPYARDIEILLGGYFRANHLAGMEFRRKLEGEPEYRFYVTPFVANIYILKVVAIVDGVTEELVSVRFSNMAELYDLTESNPKLKALEFRRS